MADRLAGEYELDVIFEAAPYAEARWLGGADADIEDFSSKYRTAMAEDIDGQTVYLAKSAWDIGYVRRRFPEGVVPEDAGAGVAPNSFSLSAPQEGEGNLIAPRLTATLKPLLSRPTTV